MEKNRTLLDYQSHWEKIVNRGFKDYQSLYPKERMWFNIQGLIGDVDNGGLISHYYNSGADRNRETIEDLDALGFSDIADLMRKLNELFPGGRPSLDINERNKVISSWPDSVESLLDEVDTAFYSREKKLEDVLIEQIV